MLEEYKLFAHNLQYFMDKYGYTQLSLSEKLSVRNTAVSTWVKGEKFPRMKTLNDLCDIFHCTKADLLQIEQKDRTDDEKAMFERLFIYAQHLNEKGVAKVIDFIEDLKDDYFQESN